MKGVKFYNKSSYLSSFCVYGAVRGLGHMPLKRNDTQAFMRTLEREGPERSVLCWWVTLSTQVAKHSAFPLCCQKQNTVPAFLIGAERLLRVGGAVNGGKGIIGYDITHKETL